MSEDRPQRDRAPARNAIVALLGTPDRTDGSLDEPRTQEENGVRFNERWLYTHLKDDPAGAAMRVVYWMRYDFRGTFVRNAEDEPWRPDRALIDAAARRGSRLPHIDPSRNPPVKPSAQYRPASELADKPDLGGGIQEKK
ncbi:MAG TPA: hypothetical protein VFB33_02365 [Candidatus Binataceae bacterium]|jgi:hypothetical protein|nr:hypothetical protein [Candidatus Binataceae bacterium]